MRTAGEWKAHDVGNVIELRSYAPNGTYVVVAKFEWDDNDEARSAALADARMAAAAPDLLSSLREVTNILSKIHRGQAGWVAGLVVDAIDMARVYIRAADPPRPGVCQGCGCTEDRACPNGCAWANTKRTWCSECVVVTDKQKVFIARRPGKAKRPGKLRKGVDDMSRPAKKARRARR